jgi:CheY-like chemotaxis protein
MKMNQTQAPLKKLLKGKKELQNALAMAQAAELKNKTVMIIDDSEEALMLMTNYLLRGARNFSLKTYTNEYEALKEIGHHPPDVIIIDLILRQMSGDKLADIINDLHFYRGPIVFISAYPQYKQELEMLYGKEVTFLPKPLDHRQFVNTVTNLVA